MAEQDASRTEQATARRKAESRKKGQVALSRDVPLAVTLLGAMAVLYWLIGPALENLTRLMREWLTLAMDPSLHGGLTQAIVQALMVKIGMDTLHLVLPLLGAVTVLGVSSYVVQTGFLWKSDGLQMDPSRLNPMAGFGRLLSLRSVVELGKSVLKVTVIAWVGVMAIRHEIGALPQLVQYDLAGVLGMAGGLAFKMTLWIGLTIAVIAAADYGYQRFEWERSLRMTKEEVKQEQRETEGDPLLKSRVRSLQRQMARNRMMAAVPKADVVITNPTHLAVALRYDIQSMAAPIVVAKGAGFIAEQIKKVAAQHGVKVIENKFVARTLFKMVEIGGAVPSDLYRAVAEILALVYRARGKRTL